MKINGTLVFPMRLPLLEKMFTVVKKKNCGSLVAIHNSFKHQTTEHNV